MGEQGFHLKIFCSRQGNCLGCFRFLFGYNLTHAFFFFNFQPVNSKKFTFSDGFFLLFAANAFCYSCMKSDSIVSDAPRQAILLFFASASDRNFCKKTDDPTVILELIFCNFFWNFSGKI